MTIKQCIDLMMLEIERGELTGKEEVWIEERGRLKKDVDGPYWSEDDYGNKVLVVR